jgi:tetratricopeptide (TPR) repeat protein
MKLLKRPRDAASHFERGRGHYLGGDYQHAVAELTRAIEIEPDTAAAYQARGLAYARVGELERAAADFERVVELGDWVVLGREAESHELLVEAHFNCALAYEKLHRYSEALHHYDCAIELHPQHSSAWCNRGNVLLQQGDFGRAAESHTRAIELNPSDYRAYWGRAIANYQLSLLDLVAADLGTYLEIAPTDDANTATARRLLADFESRQT